MVNVFVGFWDREFKLDEENECWSIKVECEGKKVLALVDTGHMENLIYRSAYEEMVNINNVGEMRCRRIELY